MGSLGLDKGVPCERVTVIPDLKTLFFIFFLFNLRFVEIMKNFFAKSLAKNVPSKKLDISSENL